MSAFSHPLSLARGLVLAAAVFVASSSTPAQAVLIFHDSFPDSPGVVPTGWVNTAGGSNNDFVVADSLSFPGLEASTGNSWRLANGTDNYTNQFTPTGTGPAVGETIYYSFLFNATAMGSLNVATSNAFLLSTTTSTSNGLASFGFRRSLTDTTKYNVVVDGQFRGSSHVDSVKGTVDYSIGETLLFVAAYARGANAAASSTAFWVNPDMADFGAGTAPTPTFTDVTVAGSPTYLMANIFGSSAFFSAGIVDEFRVGTTWADVTPLAIPEPSTVALLIGGGLAGAVAFVRRHRARCIS